ncbi:MAG TPA: hypothetical protein VND24_01275 [Steroidobacteraceae bacterium]|nr:hypothetical protein [Steroidobacteraceae bacterium]
MASALEPERLQMARAGLAGVIVLVGFGALSGPLAFAGVGCW